MHRFAQIQHIAIWLVTLAAPCAYAQGAGDPVTAQPPADEGFIAGSAPYHRPTGAPTMPAPDGGEARLARLARGVEAPIPDGVARLNVPGRWFTPFEHPGMTAPYDLRGWHRGATGRKP